MPQVPSAVHDLFVEREVAWVLCVDLLGTRERIRSCMTRQQLVALAVKLHDTISAATMEARKWAVAFAADDVLGHRDLDKDAELNRVAAGLPDVVKQSLVQDTIVIVVDMAKSLGNGLVRSVAELVFMQQLMFELARRLVDHLLNAGYLPRGGLGCGTCMWEESLVLGSAFIDAYDYAEGEERAALIGVQVSPDFRRLQDEVHQELPSYPDVDRCLEGEYLKFPQNRICVDPQLRMLWYPETRERIIYAMGKKAYENFRAHAARLRTNNCREPIRSNTIDMYGRSLLRQAFLDEDEWATNLPSLIEKEKGAS